MVDTAGENRDELMSDVLQWTPTRGQNSAGQPANTSLISSVRTLDQVKSTCQ